MVKHFGSGTRKAVDLLSPRTMPPMDGLQRIALHSLFRIICEANQLSVIDVVNAFHYEILRSSASNVRRGFRYLDHIDAGSVQSQRLIAFLESATEIRGLLHCTLANFSDLSGGPSLIISKHRKWCPLCYSQDLVDGLPPYNRLLWSVDIVDYCPFHQVRLTTRCEHCGRSFPLRPRAFDISGFCPKCHNWLGNHDKPDLSLKDEDDLYKYWCSLNIAELIGDIPIIRDSHPTSLSEAIHALIKRYHHGVMAHFAKHIGRNKSVVASWLGGTARPRWDALCAISYAHSLSLRSLMIGQIYEEGPFCGQVRNLPSSVISRHTGFRKAPTARIDLERMVIFMRLVQIESYPDITSMKAVAARLGTNIRELYRLTPEIARETSAALAVQSMQRRADRSAQKRRHRDEAVLSLAAEFAQHGGGVSRRAVESKMAQKGYVVSWRESKEVVALVRRQTAQASAPFKTDAAE